MSTVVNCTTLRLREGPGLDRRILGEVPAGTSLNVVGRQGEWAKVVHQGRVVYAHTDHLRFEEGSDREQGTLNVRRTPSLDGAVIGHLHAGERIQGTATGGDWVKISYQGSPAYVFAAFLQAEGGAVDPVPPPPTTPGTDPSSGPEPPPVQPPPPAETQVPDDAEENPDASLMVAAGLPSPPHNGRLGHAGDINAVYKAFNAVDAQNILELHRQAWEANQAIYQSDGNRRPDATMTDLEAVQAIFAEAAARSRAKVARADGSVDRQAWVNTFLMYLDGVFLGNFSPGSFELPMPGDKGKLNVFRTAKFSHERVCFGARGFHPNYDDFTGNQIGHMMVYMKVAYIHGSPVADAANGYHEWESRDQQKGASSREDFFLGKIGIEMAKELSLYADLTGWGGKSPKMIARQLKDYLGTDRFFGKELWPRQADALKLQPAPHLGHDEGINVPLPEPLTEIPAPKPAFP